MHQLLCGVEDAVFVGGYRIEVLEVTQDVVRIGLSTGDSGHQVHEIKLTELAAPASRPTAPLTPPPSTARWHHRVGRSTIN